MIIFPNLKIQYFLNQIKPYGKMVYEYNPFRNFRLSYSRDSSGNRQGIDPNYNSSNKTLEPGAIVDLDTENLNFDLNNPVDIVPQYSYDGSVNLILNDNKNVPRLINSRFSTLQNNTYEVVDRVGNNDTNLYDENQFDIDSSLYKRVTQFPTITYNGVSGSGNLKVGNYCLYFKYCDADDNESDFIGQSGIISLFMGDDCDPFSINGGYRDMNSNKQISITLTSADTNYDYIKVYYSRTTSDLDQSRIVQAYKITQKYPLIGSTCNLLISGNENIEDIPITEINAQFFIADKAKCQAICQNMLFLGNINKPDLMYQDLSDVSLRILPYIESDNASKTIGNIDWQYTDGSAVDTPYEYYNTKNIYYHVGYWNEEIYRLGIVYIMKDGSYSPVYNIRGKNKIPTFNNLFDTSKNGYTYDNFSLTLKNDDGTVSRQYITSDEETHLIVAKDNNEQTLENVKGVCRLYDDNITSSNTIKLTGIGIFIPNIVTEYLKDKVAGYFIVRQKRIPTILGQCFTMGMDLQSNLPVLHTSGSYSNKANIKFYIESFLQQKDYNSSKRVLVQDYNNRLCKVSSSAIHSDISRAGICPEYEMDIPHYNQLFTGSQFILQKSQYQSSYDFPRQDSFYSRHYINDSLIGGNPRTSIKTKIISVNDSVPVVTIKDRKYRALAGSAEEAFRFKYIGYENKIKEAYNLVRGAYGPYIGLYGSGIDISQIYNIYIPDYAEYRMNQYFIIRYQNNQPYYAIGDIYSIQNNLNINTAVYTSTSNEKTNVTGTVKTYYRGDCYICNYTHRLNRNFQDPTAPNNDEIVDENTWNSNYNIDNKESNANINRGDVNAIQLGSWITSKFYSSVNLSIRSLDYSRPDEEALTGIKRGFYPLQPISVDGNSKIPESSVINKGFGSTTGEKIQFTLPDVPYIKNRFDNRIIYSDIAVNDSFKNGFRTFRANHYRDYPRTYGGLIKLVELSGNLVTIFEHGVAIIPVNERAVAGEGQGGNVFINTSNVLPENPKMLSDMYGSQWPESVIKTPYYIYGVDTVGKKIWRTNGGELEIISDFKIAEFLINNISLTERELTPISGIRNVKTHYNAYKSDVMFTFYDNKEGFEEKVWNICWNEILQTWQTFYSWVPSYSENIDNMMFSFDRNTSKWISKLGTTSNVSTSADGITLNSLVDTSKKSVQDSVEIDKWIDNGIQTIDSNNKLVKIQGALLSLSNRNIPDISDKNATIINTFSLERDNFLNYKLFDIKSGNTVIYKTLIKKYLQDQNPGKFSSYKILSSVDSTYFTSANFTKEGIITDPKYNPYYKNCKYDQTTNTYQLLYSLDSGLMWNTYSYTNIIFMNPKINYSSNETDSSGKTYYQIYLDNIHNGFIYVLGTSQQTPDNPTILVGGSYWTQIELKPSSSNLAVSDGYIYAKQEYINDDPQYLLSKNKLVSGYEQSIYNSESNNKFTYINKLTNQSILTLKSSGTASLYNSSGTKETITWTTLETNPLYVAIKDTNKYTSTSSQEITANDPRYTASWNWWLNNFQKSPVIQLNLQCKLQVKVKDTVLSSKNELSEYLAGYSGTSTGAETTFDYGIYQSAIALTTSDIVSNSSRYKPNLTTDFWKHGQAGIIDIKDPILPTFWYGKQHPFEFEVIVNDNPQTHKLFDNLIIIGNKAIPDSFHYEIIGECFDFADDKKNMYIRQEATKDLYQYNGSDILYNNNFLDLVPNQQNKSTQMPLYYSRQDDFNNIEDYYRQATSPNKDYSNLSGSEIVYYKNLNEYRIWNHVKAQEINSAGRLRGNMNYQEDLWQVQINPIILVQKNETIDGKILNSDKSNSSWSKSSSNKRVPNITLGNSSIPSDTFVGKDSITKDDIPNDLKTYGYDNENLDFIDTTSWGVYPVSRDSNGNLIYADAHTRKEIKIKDKFMKVRIRYSGEDLVIISALKTIYSISFA